MKTLVPSLRCTGTWTAPSDRGRGFFGGVKVIGLLGVDVRIAHILSYVKALRVGGTYRPTSKATVDARNFANFTGNIPCVMARIGILFVGV